MKRTNVLEIAGLFAALALAMLPVKASAYDHCPPGYARGGHHASHSYHGGYHGGRQALVWPGDARHGGYAAHGGGHHVVQQVVVVRTVRLAQPVGYRSHVGYSHGYAAPHGRRHHHD